MRESDEARFWAKVDRAGTSDCWKWIGCVTGNGYGTFGMENSIHSPHRIAYELSFGPIPAGRHIHHRCRNRLCCNAAHLELVTPQQHPLLDDTAAARAAQQTHCINGHPFDLLNTRITPQGRRRCRACHAALEKKTKRWREKTPEQVSAAREANRRYQQRKKASHQPDPPVA